MMTEYDRYNREERALCAHLFRLLHEGLATDPRDSYLRRIVDKCELEDKELEAWMCIRESAYCMRSARIYCEVALLRDAAYPEEQRRLRLDRLRDRMEELNRNAERANKNKRWNFHGLLSAKPDLAIAFPNLLLVFEAKFTMGFDGEQLARTNDVVSLWKDPTVTCSGHPLWSDLGLSGGADTPSAVLKLGSSTRRPHLSWQHILNVMNDKGFPKNDRTYVAFKTAIALLETGKGREAVGKGDTV